jgi:hypothetical protein
MICQANLLNALAFMGISPKSIKILCVIMIATVPLHRAHSGERRNYQPYANKETSTEKTKAGTNTYNNKLLINIYYFLIILYTIHRHIQHLPHSISLGNLGGLASHSAEGAAGSSYKIKYIVTCISD